MPSLDPDTLHRQLGYAACICDWQGGQRNYVYAQKMRDVMFAAMDLLEPVQTYDGRKVTTSRPTSNEDVQILLALLCEQGIDLEKDLYLDL